MEKPDKPPVQVFEFICPVCGKWITDVNVNRFNYCVQQHKLSHRVKK